MRWGVGRDVGGVVLMLTLGTGIGTFLFVDHREIQKRRKELRDTGSVRFGS
jgi:predicted NBD/HSP70 family sugar kinase